MNLYLIERLDREATGYDEAIAFVIRANNEDQAREFAAAECGDEGEDIWRDPEQVGATALAVSVDGPAAMILRDFHAG